MNSSFKRCENCGNHCLLTINSFTNGEAHIAGNRCENGLGLERQKTEKLPNLYQYKYNRTFAYTPLKAEEAKRGIIGIPRALNLYENYPFWFTLLTKLGFRVELSAKSSKNLYEKGLETIPSDSVCYPAKLAHGHIQNLIEKGIRTIFYPSVVYEKNEFTDANNHYNCPIVTSYPEVIKNNMDELKKNNVKLIAPFVSLDNTKILINRIVEELKDYKVTFEEAKYAIMEADSERERYKKDIQKKGEEVLEYLRKNNKRGIVLCGKPYHIDPEINHGIPEVINSYGMAVLTEDSISHLSPLKHKLRVVDQWMYNSRLYRAATLLTEEEKLDMIQLNSFGCGLDAVTSDQISEILSSVGKMYTMIKIDEGNNLGAAKIRIRSLKAAVDERVRTSYEANKVDISYHTPIFSKEMRKTHTILSPQMSPIHFELIQAALSESGYRVEVLPTRDKTAVDEGLKYVNNDACYPAIIVVGQIISALKSGNYDLNTTSVIISQTGGGCRATNYIGFLKLGLKQAGFANIPIISFNLLGMEKQPGFKLSLELITKCMKAFIYGDLLMKVLNHTRPYEKVIGSAQLLYEKWNEKAKDNIKKSNKKVFNQNIKGIIQDFEHLELMDIKKPKVGIVGEILLKYHPAANNDIISTLEEAGAEVVVPGLLDFFLYSSYNSKFQYQYLTRNKLQKELNGFILTVINHYKKVMERELGKSKRFTTASSISHLASMASPFLSLGNQTGEGWLITAEMIELIESGASNIVCVQPLACLPNHITGKGMFKSLKEKFPQANIVPIDYDPGISEVNQLNRIKLMLSVAMKNM